MEQLVGYLKKNKGYGIQVRKEGNALHSSTAGDSRSQSRAGKWTWGSRKNKLAILGDEAPDRQGAKTQEYLDIPSFRNAVGRDASASKMLSYF
ncbi:MAG: hypothetical protein WB818_06705 [Desulfobacterales bacterium]